MGWGCLRRLTVRNAFVIGPVESEKGKEKLFILTVISSRWGPRISFFPSLLPFIPPPFFSIFQGTWKNDRIQGEGRLTCKNALVYVGEWSANSFHGVGKLSLPTGIIYEGNFVRGRKQGRGCFKYPDDSIYVGDVEDGMVRGISHNLTN